LVEFAFCPEESTPFEYREFWRLWAAGEYFDCHETLEVLWRRAEGERKLFYHGLIHCAVALYQAQRGNAIGALRQCVRAEVKLARYAPEYSGLDISALLQFVENEVAPLHGVLTPRQRNGLKNLRRAVIKSLESHEQSGERRGER
jgi:predicted metal-dependent hydrolase